MKKRPARRLVPPRKRTPPKPSEAHKKQLTLKQRRFISNKLQGQSSAQAARHAGYSESVARKADAIISSSPGVKAALSEILREAGVTNELLAERMWQGLNATIVSKKTAYARREVLVDYKERREMTELVLRLKGELTNRHEFETAGDWPTRIAIELVGARCGRCGVQGPARRYGSEFLCERCANQMQDDSLTSNSNSDAEQIPNVTSRN